MLLLDTVINFINFKIIIMKTIYFLSCVFLSLFLFSSCNDEIINSNLGLISTRSAGDGKYDLLGYGYDCTFSVFKGSRYGKARIIDIDRFLSGQGRDPITRVEKIMSPGNINIALLHGGGEVEAEWGADLNEYSQGQHNRYNVKSNINAFGLKLFTADLKSYYSDSSRFSNAYCFYRANIQKATRKLTMSEVSPSYLKYFLTDEFLDNLATYTGDQMVAKYGTHVLTDILLGGVSSTIFNAKMTSISNQKAFKNEADLFINQLSAGTGTTEAQKRFNNFKDVKISIKTYGGTSAIDQKISFDPFTGQLGNISFNYTDWMNSVTQSAEQIIGIGNNTTEICLLSDFIGNTTKKKEIEDAIIRYCEKQKVNMLSTPTFDYEEGVIYYNLATDSKNYLLVAYDIDYSWEAHSSHPAYLNRLPIDNRNPWEINTSGAWRVRWTFYPYGEYYRIGIKVNDGRDMALAIGQATLPFFNDGASDQLWDIESVVNQKDTYMLKHVSTGQYLCSTDHKLHPKNPNDKTLWFKIKITSKK
ncbi:Membrane attack complex component/perforin (MACPF) domain protein [Bacteroides helcogenes P 36-108]|uniref:Membrane attack complex component/perforin (MACPF) domain protein n=2 Tax=Bacteroides helcogenes TaxID=290053 RepID=E6SUP7_BACT6|nr:Membrane attack complex component/perforin (MACPF) domain protein [Bacteroides helcogenes P 36-108]